MWLKLLGVSGGFLLWNASFLRAVQDWEIGVFSDFLYPVGDRDGGSDNVFWMISLLEKGNSMSIHSRRPLPVNTSVLFLGGVCLGVRRLLRSLSLFGQLLWGWF